MAIPTATVVATATRTLAARAADPNPTTPAFVNGLQWITAYLAIHMLSVPSRRYSYLLWIAIVFGFLIFAIAHWTGSRGGVLGAYWSKWAIRRRTVGKWRTVKKKGQTLRKQPMLLPSNAQLLCLTALFAAAFLLSFVGPDYIKPNTPTWNWTKRSVELGKRKLKYDPNDYVGFAPQYTIAKAWWTVGGRTGMIAFAFLPLCILFAIKAPPFALFAVPFMIQIHFDKLAWLHRWCGRLIWFLSALHVATWSVQLWNDHKTSPFADSKDTNKRAYFYAWQFERFIYAWIAFGLFTAIVLLSILPLRRDHYETFWFLHVLLVPMAIVMAALHHPPIWYWCWAALAIWGGERLWRAGFWLWNNGFLGTSSASRPSYQRASHVHASGLKESAAYPLPSPVPPVYQDKRNEPVRSIHDTHSPISPAVSARFTPTHPNYPSESSVDAFLSSQSEYSPPPGYAQAELLAGRTVRLTFTPPRQLSWAPGQHFLICIPSVSSFLSHPFTVASVSDLKAPTASGRQLVILVRAKAGWTRDLWDEVMSLTVRGFRHHPMEKQPPDDQLPPRGLLMRMWVDGPFGSSIRARWGHYSTALIVSGGSGVSFGLSVLEYLCLCMAGRDGRELGGRPGGWGKRGFMTRRVRFVWLVREFSHIQWCATVLRRCRDLIPEPGLQINIFVTNLSSPPKSPRPRIDTSYLLHSVENDHLAPPTPQYAKAERQRRDSVSSVESDAESDLSEIDLSYYTGGPSGTNYDDSQDDMVQTGTVLDLTNFDGEDDTALPGEARLSRQLQKTGRHKRTLSRKAHSAQASRSDLSKRGEFSGSARAQQSTDKLLGNMSKPMSPIEEDYMSGYNSPRSPSVMSPSDSDTLVANQGYPPPRLPWGGSRPVSMAFTDESHLSTTRPSTTMSNWETRSMAGLIEHTTEEGFRLDVDPREMRDINAISEYARPGRPLLERILSDEVEQSRGAVVVACCGPTSLNAVLRKAISSQINPSRIRRGDMRGSIALVSEEFEY
ncbi:hypothetical protein PUNSTDRAFT_121472 [Punctularia strigosozonata HHB-11173 SS5]|uniref:uncharacterized protein n=1 Tax=Punctularia strigosozonata (strain HHB-11173) TaxID=741275 RepID=UPI0004416BE8|nr:uncharacterized protein PUNSTDRAFT_121472 [Punctularia strigosozonata HHB-11173 SS5]EIN07321.1 hypothetical protein PUNSTDRAFT_121472 [Punctularia strigosozonata HHB-11173 SS5]